MLSITAAYFALFKILYKWIYRVCACIYLFLLSSSALGIQRSSMNVSLGHIWFAEVRGEDNIPGAELTPLSTCSWQSSVRLLLNRGQGLTLPGRLETGGCCWLSRNQWHNALSVSLAFGASWGGGMIEISTVNSITMFPCHWSCKGQTPSCHWGSVSYRSRVTFT